MKSQTDLRINKVSKILPRNIKNPSIVRISSGLFQPIAADDVALAAPRNGTVEIAGPERARFNEIVARYLRVVGDPRQS
jgi:uncharacterized protein YbjT (DUF2867 family)